MKGYYKHVDYDIEQLQYQRYREEEDLRHGGCGLVLAMILLCIAASAVASMMIY